MYDRRMILGKTSEEGETPVVEIIQRGLCEKYGGTREILLERIMRTTS